MGKLVSLDEQEEYERELARAHAENRAPALRDPHEVFTENIGNADSHLEELSEAEVKSATNKLHRDRKKAQEEDKRLEKVIRSNVQAVSMDGGPTLPYEAPNPDKFQAPKTKEQKEFADRQVAGLVDKGKHFDDSFSDLNIPNVDDEGHVLGDSVNRVMTRKMTTFSEDELVRENEKNSVPVPERFKRQNPPQVVQQSNPVTGEPPTPEVTGNTYVDTYAVNTDNGNEELEGVVPTADDVPLTAISIPYPEHVIGDETGTTHDPSRDNETDIVEPADGPETPSVVPLMQGQVLQGAVKRPDHFNPPVDRDELKDVPQGVAAGIFASSPVDTPPGLREDNQAQKAAKKAMEVQLPGNVDNVNITDEQKKLQERVNKGEFDAPTVLDEKK